MKTSEALEQLRREIAGLRRQLAEMKIEQHTHYDSVDITPVWGLPSVWNGSPSTYDNFDLFGASVDPIRMK